MGGTLNPDAWVAALLVPLALWVLLNGIDDLVVDFALVFRRLWRNREPMPGEADLAGVPERRMAIYVPLWKEHRVIQNMVEHNIAAQKYKNYDFFIGVYPNDAPTLAAVNEVVRRFANVHLAVCPHGGPTSKADCLNWIYQRMLLYEEENGARFEAILTHDAEDLVHPDALRWINYYAQWHDMVQIPVLALPTHPLEFTHGVYCDDFAEFQLKDMPARAWMGGFIPSNGVGTGFSREALERLASAHANCIFEPSCLTEDYENGFRIHRLGMPQKFVPVHRHGGSFVATREYFPRTLTKAVRQRTRWVTGIGLQSWELHGWRDTASQLYWLWRDRKSVVGSLVTPLTNVVFVYGAVTLGVSRLAHQPWGLAHAVHGRWVPGVYGATLLLQAVHVGTRTFCSAHVYGWTFASAAPVRLLWANLINCLATISAIRRYATAKLRGHALVWLKTDHAYPNRAALTGERPKLSEVLIGSNYVTPEDYERAVKTKPAGMRIGEWLIRNGKLTEEQLYEALALHYNVPLGRPPDEEISIPVTRTLPASVSREIAVMPFRIVAGQLYVAGTDFPSEQTAERIAQFCPLEIRFHLMTPTDFSAMTEIYLPA